jgi:hypothetical protein
MFMYEDTAENHLKSLGYKKMERRPWNVREDDVIILENWGGTRMPTTFIPVRVWMTDKYSEYRRTDTVPTKYTKVSQTTYELYHKALNESDAKHLYGRWTTRWYSFDTVEIWRKS